MPLKTRDKLIETARQLFARKGIEHTTMSDIAEAGGRGRRTLYTYFRTKRDIYDAVIERESEALVARVRAVLASPLSPPDKLRRYLEERFAIIDDAVQRRDLSLRNIFSRDYRRIDRIRRLAIAKERILFQAIIDEGVARGCFRADLADSAPTIEAILFQGVDYSYLRGNFEDLNLTRADMQRRLIQFLVTAITIP